MSEAHHGSELGVSVDAAAEASAQSAGLLQRAERTLTRALSDDGLNLWRYRWLERLLRPMLAQVLAEQPLHPGWVHVRAADLALVGVDELPWAQRAACAKAALLCIQAARTSGPEQDAPKEKGEWIVLPELPEAPPPAPVHTPDTPTPQPAGEDTESEPAQPLGAPGATGKPVLSLDGCSDDLAERLGEQGIETIADLLSLMPEEHQILSLHEADTPLEEGPSVALRGVIKATAVRYLAGTRREEAALDIGDRVVRCTWMGPRPQAVQVGAELVLAGELELVEDGAVLFEPMDWRLGRREDLRRPLYGLDTVEDVEIWSLQREALDRYAGSLLDPLPENLVREFRLQPLEQALEDRHRPIGTLRSTQIRPAFEELMVHQLSAASRQKTRLRGIAHAIQHEALSRYQIESRLTLGDAQELAFDEIRRDLRRSTAMTRLLQGDVGSGKSHIALMAALLVAETRAQVCFLGPSDIAAEHRYLFAEPLLRAAGLVPQLVTGQPSLAQADAIRRGETHAIFATHALLEDFPEFKKLGLVIVEERDQFGVCDRAVLSQKGVNPDLLVVTSVPIPLSLTFTLFSDHDLSVLREPQPQYVQTRVSGPDQRERVYQRVREELELGRQAYVVFPTKGEKDLLDLHSARQLTEALAKEAFPGARLALYHGNMGREERFRVFEDFQRRRIDVLVCTTTIEDAPEVANATAMMVDHADRYGLVRLHRLRGHVAQGRSAGHCEFVLTAQPSTEGKAVVDLVAAEQDGFAIAEKDREARGDAALLAGREDALPDFRFADPIRDRSLLLKARRAALGLLNTDPQLRQRNHRGLLRLLREYDLEFGGSPVSDSSSARGKRTRGRRRRRRRRK